MHICLTENMEAILPYRVIEIRNGQRIVCHTEYAAEAIALGEAAEADGAEVLVAYPDDPVENTLAWFRSSVSATGGDNA